MMAPLRIALLLNELKGMFAMKTETILNEIRELNFSYLLLAKHMIREDREQAMYRLGLSEGLADTLDALTTAQVMRMAATNMLICRFRFDDEIVWNLLTSHGKEHNQSVGGVHAAILMSGMLAEVA
jgi:flagellar transcriptional activator FlhD